MFIACPLGYVQLYEHCRCALPYRSYLDASADVETAVKVVVDAKTDYPVPCNSVAS